MILILDDFDPLLDKLALADFINLLCSKNFRTIAFLLNFCVFHLTLIKFGLGANIGLKQRRMSLK